MADHFPDATKKADFIRRDGILTDIQEDIDFKSLTLTEDANNRMNDGLRLAQRRIRKYPAADVIPVEWIEAQVDKGKWAELIQRWRER